MQPGEHTVDKLVLLGQIPYLKIAFQWRSEKEAQIKKYLKAI